MTMENGAVVAYVVVGISVALVAGGVAVWCCRCRNRNRQPNTIVVDESPQRPPVIGINAVVSGLQTLVNNECGSYGGPRVVSAKEGDGSAGKSVHHVVAIQGYSSRTDVTELRACAAAARAANKQPVLVNIKDSDEQMPLLRTMGSEVDTKDPSSRQAVRAILKYT